MVNAHNLHLYVAIKNRFQHGHTEDTLVTDSCNKRAFSGATESQTAFQATPVRIVIAEGRFADGFKDLNLVQDIRRRYLAPYVYALVLSMVNNLKQIWEVLAAKEADYLVRPTIAFRPFCSTQVGMRRLN